MKARSGKMMTWVKHFDPSGYHYDLLLDGEKTQFSLYGGRYNTQRGVKTFWNLFENGNTKIPLYNTAVSSGFTSVVNCKKSAEMHLKTLL